MAILALTGSKDFSRFLGLLAEARDRRAPCHRGRHRAAQGRGTNKVVLAVVALIVVSVVGFNWIYERNEPAFLTPIVDKIAASSPARRLRRQAEDDAEGRALTRGPVVIARPSAWRDDEAIQLDRHGALRDDRPLARRREIFVIGKIRLVFARDTA